MYTHGDDIYIVDNGRWAHKNEIVIQKRRFVNYTSSNHKTLIFDGETSLEAETWATSPTVEDATKFAVAYLIKTECFGENVTFMDSTLEYSKLEETEPNLIFKYMDKVVEN
jgi:hypothetical protein